MSVRGVDGLMRRPARAMAAPVPSPVRPVRLAAAPLHFNHALAFDGIQPRRMTPRTNLLELSDSLDATTTRDTTNRLLRKWARVGSGVAIVGLSAVIGHNIWMSQQIARQNQVAVVRTTPTTPLTSTHPAVLASAESLLQSFASRFPGSPGFVVTDLRSGQTTALNEHQVFTSASLYKLFVAYGVYHQIDAGALSLSTPIGASTVGACLDRMITVSDNPCGIALGNLVGWEKQNASIQAAGFSDTALARHSDELTSAADVARLFQRLYNGTLLSTSSNQHFLELLKNQKINNRLPAGLPAGTAVAHKTGDLDGLVHDAGIVYSPGGDYIVTILSGPWASPADAPAAFSELSSGMYRIFNPLR